MFISVPFTFLFFHMVHNHRNTFFLMELLLALPRIVCQASVFKIKFLSHPIFAVDLTSSFVLFILYEQMSVAFF